MFGIGAQELILILVVALLVFGPKRLPELARTMGKGLAEFRRASSDLRHSLQGEFDSDESRSHPASPAKPLAKTKVGAGEDDDRPAMAGDTDGPSAALKDAVEDEHRDDPDARNDEPQVPAAEADDADGADNTAGEQGSEAKVPKI